MSNTETFLVFGAFVIFTIATLYLNDTKFDNEKILMETEFKITADGIAQSFIEEASGKRYDEKLNDPSFSGPVPAGFTPVDSLGADPGETYANFDDVDDFNNFSQTVSTPRGTYSVNISVSYADTLTFQGGIANTSFYKSFTISVTSAYYPETISYNYLFCFN